MFYLFINFCIIHIDIKKKREMLKINNDIVFFLFNKSQQSSSAESSRSCSEDESLQLAAEEIDFQNQVIYFVIYFYSSNYNSK